MTTNGQAPFPAPWINGRFGTCCLDFCGHPNMELRPCANRSQTGCNKGCHRVCAQAAGLEPNGGYSGKFFCSKACMDGTNTNPNSNNSTNTANNPNSTTNFSTMEEAFDPANNPVVADAIQRKAELEANITPPPTPKPTTPSPAEEIRDEDMNLHERRKRFGPQGATHFQRGVNRRHDEGHLGGAHGRQPGMAYYNELLPEEGEEQDTRAGGLKCAECGKDCPRKVHMCPGCRWSMHATCGILGLLDARYRYCGGCLAELPRDQADRLGKRDAATKKRLIEAGALPPPRNRKRRTNNKSTVGGSSSSKRSSNSSSGKRKRTGTGGSGRGSRNNNNNNNTVGASTNNGNGNATTTGADNNNNNNTVGASTNNGNGNATATGADNNNNNNNAAAATSGNNTVAGSSTNDAADATTNDSGRRILANPITTDQMRHGVVDPEVFSRYVNECIHFMRWLKAKYPDWLTDYCKEKTTEADDMVVEGEKTTAKRKRIKQVYMDLIKNSPSDHIIVLEKWTPEIIMEYLAEQANQYTGKKLSETGYSGKRSAIKHLVRCQHGQYWSETFNTRMEILWKGFMRLNNPKEKKVKKKRRKKSSNNNQGQEQQEEAQPQEPNDANSDSEDESDYDSDDDREDFKQGKSPMSTELYRNILRWFLAWGNVQGVFCACYICMTWHLACRTNNTARVKFSHMSWTIFDAMHVGFRHTKTQQHGQAKRHKRALYSNTYNWEMDFPLLLGLWLSKGFNSAQKTGNRLFPGGANAQSKRVGDLLRQLLLEHKDEVLAMGYDSVEEIGLHSIRKGVSTYLASLPGGPPPAALCLRAGWSMGKVKDIYFHQTQGGDEFVGRCASMLNLMNGEFASSPAFFKSTINQAAKREAIELVFPQFRECEGMERILEQCLASMVYHKDDIQSLDVNHPARSVVLYTQADLYLKLKDHVTVANAWDASGVEFTGIPPHIKSLVDIAGIKQEQSKLVEKVYKKVMEGVTAFFEEKEIGGGNLTESRIKNMISQSLDGPMKTLTEQISKISAPNATITAEAADADTTNTTTETTTNQHGGTVVLVREFSHHGVTTRVPKNFRFPTEGVLDLWQKWNVPDTNRHIPPLRVLLPSDYGYLDTIPKTEEEKRGSKGKYKNNKRPSRKTYSDMKFICEYIEKKAKGLGMDVKDRSITNINRIYQQVAPIIYEGTKESDRDTQHKWLTFVSRLRKKVKKERDEEARHKLARNAAARAASRAAAAALAERGRKDNNNNVYDTDDDGYMTGDSRGDR